MTESADKLPEAKARRRWGRAFLLPALIALGLAAVFLFHLDHYLTFQSLATNRAWLLRQVAENLVVTVLLFSAIYVVATALSVPGSAILTMTAGFLFGMFFGAVIAVVSATLGGTLLFVIARTSLGEIFRRRSEGTLTKLREGFAKGAFNYLLFLRLVPVFPFWLVNLVAAFLDVPPRTFVLGTAIGIIPGAAVYASVGSGVGALLDRGETPQLGVIFSPQILLPILALAVLSLVPIVYRRFRQPESHLT